MDNDSIPRPFFIEFTCDHDEWPSLDEEVFDTLTQNVLKKINWDRPFNLSVVLTNDKEIQKLNAAYLKKDAPTNVLSFASYDENLLNLLPKTEPILLGDIILSFETIKKQTIDQQKSFENHVYHLFVHGLLHLFGYDHENDVEAETMEQLEIDILATLSIPNPYEVIESI